MSSGEWPVYLVNEVRDWIDLLDDATHSRVVQVIDTLPTSAPVSCRPLVDTIHGSSIANFKGTPTGTIRILLAFDPWRDSTLLVVGDESGKRELLARS